MESGEGIESQARSRERSALESRVESGEGIESLEYCAGVIDNNMHMWNPVKELKAPGIRPKCRLQRHDSGIR